MTTMRTMRVNIVTGDTDCLPDILVALSEPCLCGSSLELSKILSRAPSQFKSPAAFWTAVVYALGWTPDPRQLFNYREDVRNAIIGCSAVFRRLAEREVLTPHEALQFLLTETVGDYGRAASLLGIDVSVQLPLSFGNSGRTFTAVRIAFNATDKDTTSSVSIAQISPLDGSVKELYFPDLYERQAYSIEVCAPADQFYIKVSTELQEVEA